MIKCGRLITFPTKSVLLDLSNGPTKIRQGLKITKESNPPWIGHIKLHTRAILQDCTPRMPYLKVNLKSL